MNIEQYRRNQAARLLAEKPYRVVCPRCTRPETACYCRHIMPFASRPKFVILMHPDETDKRIASGRMTHLCLSNSLLYEGVNFTHRREVKELLANPRYYPILLFPSQSAVDISVLKPQERRELFPPHLEPLVFLLDATWSQARKMKRLSTNLASLPQFFFTPKTPSTFRVRKQPREGCYSTIEATHEIIHLLGEGLPGPHANLLHVFNEMVTYQLTFQTRFGPTRRRSQLGHA